MGRTACAVACVLLRPLAFWGGERGAETEPVGNRPHLHGHLPSLEGHEGVCGAQAKAPGGLPVGPLAATLAEPVAQRSQHEVALPMPGCVKAQQAGLGIQRLQLVDLQQRARRHLQQHVELSAVAAMGPCGCLVAQQAAACTQWLKLVKLQRRATASTCTAAIAVAGSAVCKHRTLARCHGRFCTLHVSGSRLDLTWHSVQYN